MPKFEVETSFTGYRTWEVEAETEEAARQKYFEGTATNSEEDDEWVVDVNEV